jgi:hypothetical protein
MEPCGAFIVCVASDATDNKQQPRGPRPKPPEDTMQSITHSKPAKAMQPSKRQPRKPAALWQPQSGSLTREEIRAIVIDQIG